MSIQICLLKTGETVIADIKQAMDKETNKVVGYRVTNPYVVNLNVTNTAVIVKENQIEDPCDSDNDIKFIPWAPLAKKAEFDFTEEFVDVIYEPHDSVVQGYISLVEHYTQKFTHKIIVDADQSIPSYNDNFMVDAADAIEGMN